MKRFLWTTPVTLLTLASSAAVVHAQSGASRIARSVNCVPGDTSSLFVGQPGVPGFVDGTGSSARIGSSGGLATDGTYLYFADTTNHAIRRITIATALVETIAGDGTAGFQDDPAGANARFFAPESLTTDGTTLWVGDMGNFRLRAVDLLPPYSVTTLAGSGAQGHLDGVGTAAEFDDIRGVTFSRGIVYLLDGDAATLRSFDPLTGQVTTLAGSPYQLGFVDGAGANARFTNPRYMTGSMAGILYISETNGASIRSFNSRTNVVRTFAGNGVPGYSDGIGTAASVHRPRGITTDRASVFWVEFNQHTVRRGILATGLVTTWVGTHCGGASPCPGGYAEGSGSSALFNGPFAVVMHCPSESLFVLDSGNFVIRRIQ